MSGFNDAKRMGGYVDSFNSRPYAQGLFEESTTQKHKLGTLRITDDGRWFRYAQITAAAITEAGVLLSKVQAPVDATVAAADAAIAIAGAKSVTCTAAGITAHQLKDGELVIKAGADIAMKYKIRDNTATGDPAAGRIRCELYEAVNTTWVAANTTIALYDNPYKSLLINPAVADSEATTNETVMGMSVRPITASCYVWVQTHGVAALTLDVAAAAGNEANEQLIVAGVTAGRGALIIPLETTFYWGTQIIGKILENADLTNAEGNLVFLTIE